MLIKFNMTIPIKINNTPMVKKFKITDMNKNE